MTADNPSDVISRETKWVASDPIYTIYMKLKWLAIKFNII